MDAQNAIVSKATVTLVPADADKFTRSRLGHFVKWQRASGLPWHEPDLAQYRDDMLADGKAPATVAAYVSTVRACYRAVVTDNGTRQALFDQAAQEIGLDSAADRKAWVDETLTRIENAIDPEKSKVKRVIRQDIPDSEHLRLTSEQASRLLASPGVVTLAGLRDTAVIALLLCTGVREAELCALDVRDLRQTLSGELALHVRLGKGCKERLIPYGAMDWALAIVDKWLEVAGIDDGPVFRGLYKGGQRLRPGRLSVRAVGYILDAYPITVEGRLRVVHPHDCRRTYARRLYDAGVAPVAIQQNLGHSGLRTTLVYIGDLDAEARRAPDVYSFDLVQLSDAPVQRALGAL
jgi:integrase